MRFEVDWSLPTALSKQFLDHLLKTDFEHFKVISQFASVSPETGVTDVRACLAPKLSQCSATQQENIVKTYKEVVDGDIIADLPDDFQIVLMEVNPDWSGLLPMSAEDIDYRALLSTLFKENNRLNQVTMAMDSEMTELREDLDRLRSTVGQMSTHPFYTAGYAAMVNAMYSMAKHLGYEELLPELEKYQLH